MNNELTDTTLDFPRRQGETARTSSVGASVTKDEYRNIVNALVQGGFESQSMGVRTVVNLRSFHSDREELEGLDLRYEHIFMKAWHPEREEVVRFLRIVADPQNQPVFVHCQHGADRTGLMCAIYRVAMQGWSKEEAEDEMRNGGYGYHVIWKNLIRYLEKLDVDALKREAGVEGAPHGEGAPAVPNSG